MSSLTSLLTDRYELTMVQAALANGTAHRPCAFEVFNRRLRAGRRYNVVAGTGRLLDAVENFRFSHDQLVWLDENGIVDKPTLEYLENFKFSGDIFGYAEGETFFPGSPILTVHGTFAEAVLLETVILSILNFDSAVATAASRMVIAAGDRPCLEMGSRRVQELAAVAAARATFVAGFTGTSNLQAGKDYDIPTIGTAAHSFTLLHESESEAFSAQINSLGSNTTLLVDTYDIAEGVRRAIEIGGTELDAVRIDSGDLPVVAAQVRQQLDELGATNTKIVVTSDLDEFAIARLAGAPVDSYGVGTSVVTGAGAPTCGLVYKLVARQGDNGDYIPVAKKSEGKASLGGKKFARRLWDENKRARTELIASYTSSNPNLSGLADGRDLLVPLVSAGEIHDEHRGPEALSRAQAHHQKSLDELGLVAARLSPGDPVVMTEVVEV